MAPRFLIFVPRERSEKRGMDYGVRELGERPTLHYSIVPLLHGISLMRHPSSNAALARSSSWLGPRAALPKAGFRADQTYGLSWVTRTRRGGLGLLWQ